MKLWCFLVLIFFIGCARAPLQKREDALRAVPAPQLKDDLPLAPFMKAVEQQINFLESPQCSIQKLVFSKKTYLVSEYARYLKAWLKVAKKAKNKSEFFEILKDYFQFYEVYGSKDWGDVFITGYYVSLIQGSSYRTPRFSQPLYSPPEDLVKIRLDQFNWSSKPQSTPSYLYGRMIPHTSQEHLKSIQPYYTRKEIDQENKLLSNKKGQKKILCWIDPIEAFYLQIQGSGIVILRDRFHKNKRQFIFGYAAQNGHKYEAIGKYLTNIIPLEKLTMQNIKKYLQSLPPKKLQDILNLNPSYVFFQSLPSRPLTYLGTPVVSGRTIATDEHYFPKGALGFLEFEKPIFSSLQDEEPKGWEKTARLVLDQDKGGAIRGGGRVDLFFGTGAKAGQSAGVMKGRGRLYYLAPKEIHFLKRIKK